ncbi:MAG: hypothetical protein ACK49G_05885 [Brevundimonas sp.]|uniref:hypothetical protein n=1 Tax=Brevundimonas sp. TaxID=1871086 RepID=UPI00391CC3D9
MRRPTAAALALMAMSGAARAQTAAAPEQPLTRRLTTEISMAARSIAPRATLPASSTRWPTAT